MHAIQPDLFNAGASPSPLTYADAFAAWLASREDIGSIREQSSAAVYGSMWSALTAWCVSRDLGIDDLTAGHFQAYLQSRGGSDDLSARYAWRLLTLADAVQAHRAKAQHLQRNTAAIELLRATPDWRHANAQDKTPVPEHLLAHEARALVAWLLDPVQAGGTAGAPASSWQAVRNRTAVALQLGAGLTPGDIRAALLDGVVSDGGRAAGLPWKISLPAHGSIPARDAPIAPWAGRRLRTWLQTRGALHPTGPALFPAARDGRPWGKVAQYTAAKAVLAAAGMQDTDGGSYKLRHTFALRQLRKGTPADQLARWMGLSDTAALARHRHVLLAPAGVV